MYWQRFFSVYPFTQDREDVRTAVVAWSLSNAINRLYEIMTAVYTNKKTFSFQPTDIEEFIPDYLGERVKITQPRDPQQKEEFAAFALALADANARAGTYKAHES